MKKVIILILGLSAGIGIVLAGKIPFAANEAAAQPDGKGQGLFTTTGRTRCIAGNRAIIAPAVLHPVETIHVALGDRVKKGDPLVELDADEPKADVRAKIANLESAE